MNTSIVSRLEAEADDPEQPVEIINMNLFRGVSTRPTEHKFRFQSEATPEFREYVQEEIENSSEVIGTIEDDVIHLYSDTSEE
jgi:hypothetical protein